MTAQMRVVVRGRVQGVGFRYSTVEQARQLGVTGWVRNRADGTVELVAQGTTAALDALAAWCEQGPRTARVSAVERTDEPAEGVFTTFETRR
jgi:acylphosphatase